MLRGDRDKDTDKSAAAAAAAAVSPSVAFVGPKYSSSAAGRILALRGDLPDRRDADSGVSGANTRGEGASGTDVARVSEEMVSSPPPTDDTEGRRGRGLGGLFFLWRSSIVLTTCPSKVPKIFLAAAELA